MSLQKFTKTEDKFAHLLSKKLITKRSAESILNFKSPVDLLQKL